MLHIYFLSSTNIPNEHIQFQDFKFLFYFVENYHLSLTDTITCVSIFDYKCGKNLHITN